jgi:aminopeptidase N
MRATAVLSIEALPEADRIILDTKDLAIESVTDETGLPLAHEIGPRDPLLGQPLTVTLGPTVRTIAIRYHTNPDAAAFLWLDPAQTPGKKKPFLFTQGESILTRTWIPLQDSPQVRVTYEAHLTVPSGMTAVMSAARVTEKGETRFVMKEPIPSYLIALAVGDLAFEPLGSRTGVFADPTVVKEAAHEFADLERMVSATEALYGPYRWGRYDLMMLPPSFPFGGMENPHVTFASPTVIAGDRSLVSLIAHELAHAWSGNLVTNATWADSWLNEGVTVYIERRISEQLYGADFREMIEALGREALEEEMKEEMSGNNAWKTLLHPDLAGKDPDDNFTWIPYEKGAMLLEVIEHEVGRDRFDPFLKRYFDRFAFHSMTTDRFEELLKTDLFAGDPAGPAKIDLDTWIHQPGIPSNAPNLASKRLERVVAAATAFVDKGEVPKKDAFGALEWQFFLRKLKSPLAKERLAKLDAEAHFTESKNAELRVEWLRVAIANRYETALATLEPFLLTQGRTILVVPLYKELLATDWGGPIADRTYAKAKAFYHAATRTSIEDAFKQRAAR